MLHLKALACVSLRTAMDGLRFGLAFLVFSFVCGSLFYWISIHGLVRFWRRFRPRFVIVLHVLAIVLCGIVVWFSRNHLFERVLFRHWLATTTGLLFLALSVWIDSQARKHLDWRTLAGMPELRTTTTEGRLLKEGIYSQVRHPRYLAFFFLVAGTALFSGYFVVYVLLLSILPVGYLIVRLEEKELTERFGEAYLEYARNVPRFIPRLFWRSKLTSF